MKTVSVGPYSRWRLQRYSKRIYRRLIMDRHAETISGYNSAVIVFAFALFAVFVVFAVGIWAIESGASDGLIALVPSSLNLRSEYVLGAAALVAISLVMLPLFFFHSYLSARMFNIVGWIMVQARLLSPAKQQQNISDVKYWLRTDPQRVAEEVKASLRRQCEDLLPARARNALREVRSPDNTTPAAVIHGLLERKYWYLYVLSRFRTPRPGDPGGGDAANYYILARMLRNAIKIAFCFDVLDVELRDEAANGPRWCWDYYSKTDYQQVPTWDMHDLPLRFRTASPHLRWPDESSDFSDGEIPLIRAFSGLENPMGFQLRVLSVRDVVSMLPAMTATFFKDCAGADEKALETQRKRAAKCLCILANRPVKVVGMYDYKTMQPLMGRDATDKPLLRRLDGKPALIEDHDPEEILNADWGVRWDPNRIAWSDLNPAANGEILEALSLFMDCVNEAMRDKARSVRLRRGSVLFADNQRCMIGRFEREISYVNATRKLIFQQPGEWWLRRFYGFRKSRSNDFSSSAMVQHFDARDPLPGAKDRHF